MDSSDSHPLSTSRTILTCCVFIQGGDSVHTEQRFEGGRSILRDAQNPRDKCVHHHQTGSLHRWYSVLLWGKSGTPWSLFHKSEVLVASSVYETEIVA